MKPSQDEYPAISVSRLRAEGQVLPDAIRVWLSTAESPIRVSWLVRDALDASVDDLTRKDFVAVHGLLKAFKWKRQQSARHGDRWHRPVEA